MRGRITQACYRLLGMTELVAKDPNEYVSLSIRLVNDSTWRAEIVAKIEAGSSRL